MTLDVNWPPNWVAGASNLKDAAATQTYRQLQPRQSISSSVDDPANSPSLSQLVATLVPALIFAAVFLAIFLLLRTRISRAYSPRTHLASLRSHERTPELPRGLFNWLSAFAKLSDDHVLNHSTLDGFLLLRYLKISVIICLVGTLATWPILFPVNATGGGGQQQLNRISFSNIASGKHRYYAHAILAWVFYGFVFFMVTRETIYYIHLRQAYLISPSYAQRMSSRTVLFSNVPADYRDEGHLRRMFPKANNVWIASDCSQLAKKVKERDKVAMKLEQAETKLIKMAYRSYIKDTNAKRKTNETRDTSTQGRSNGHNETESLAARWVPASKRPSHRVGFFGPKVDTIDWCRQELRSLIPEVGQLQQNARAGKYKPLGAAFIEFRTQRDAQAAYSSLAHHQALHLAPRFIGLSPDEVLWSNLNINWAFRVVRNVLTGGVVFVLLIFWAVPVAFIGALSNIKALTQGDPSSGKGPLLPWLGFIDSIPDEILGVIQGLLPSVLLALLMALLPPFLKFMARLTGKSTSPAVELRVQVYYFVFQVVQVFLVTTISSGAAAAVVQIINEPNKVTSLLAQDLPKASNFYVSYFILQGLGIASESLAQVLELVIFTVLGHLLDRTPRDMYRRYSELAGLGWGTEFPVYTLLTVIAITYAMIAPVVLGFATVGLFLIYVAYRYNLLFVLNGEIDCQGRVYVRALFQTLTGVYLGVFCLIGLFAVKQAPGPLILTIILLVVCIIFQVNMQNAIAPLLDSLPRSLEVEEESMLLAEVSEDEKETTDDPSSTIGKDIRPGEPRATVTRVTTRTMSAVASGDAPKSDRNTASDSASTTFLHRFFLPHKHHGFRYFRNLVARDLVGTPCYEPEVERDAYLHPAITAPLPRLWIPRDELGISAQECRDTRAATAGSSSEGIDMSDECATINDKGKVDWDKETEKPPIYEEKIYY